jgi:hypothetical protein
LIVSARPAPAAGTADANRNVDAILLTTNKTDVMSRATLYEAGGLSVPLDGLLTQAGEVYFKFTNTGADSLGVIQAPLGRVHPRVSTRTKHA